jgi:hypothetical protein
MKHVLVHHVKSLISCSFLLICCLGHIVAEGANRGGRNNDDPFGCHPQVDACLGDAARTEIKSRLHAGKNDECRGRDNPPRNSQKAKGSVAMSPHVFAVRRAQPFQEASRFSDSMVCMLDIEASQE